MNQWKSPTSTILFWRRLLIFFLTTQHELLFSKDENNARVEFEICICISQMNGKIILTFLTFAKHCAKNIIIWGYQWPHISTFSQEFTSGYYINHSQVLYRHYHCICRWLSFCHMHCLLVSSCLLITLIKGHKLVGLLFDCILNLDIGASTPFYSIHPILINTATIAFNIHTCLYHQQITSPPKEPR